MKDAKVVMERFMKKLSEDGFKKENQPNNGPDIDEEFINTQVESYSALLGSGIVELALGER